MLKPTDYGESCATCKFSFEVFEGGMLYCHRYPPKLVVGEEENFGEWPPVGKEDWCGEYQHD